MPHRHADRALVLGACGYLGSHVVDTLHAQGYDVVTADRSAPVDDHPIRMDFLLDDVRSLTVAIGRLRPDVVVNAMGLTAGSTADMVDANVILPARVLAAVGAAAPWARTIHLGSAAEYGPTRRNGNGTAQPVAEEAACEPTSGYGMSKLAGTRLLLSTGRDLGLAVVVLRVFNPVGPRAPASSLAGRAARLVHAAGRSDDPAPVVHMAPLDAHRDWVDAGDVADAVYHAARTAGAAGRVFNIGSGRAVPARDLVRLIAAGFGSAITIREDGGPPPRPADVSWQQADIGRAERELGWRPRTPLTDSVGGLCNWVLSGACDGEPLPV